MVFWLSKLFKFLVYVSVWFKYMAIGFCKKNTRALARIVCRVTHMAREFLFTQNRRVSFIIGGTQKGGTSALDWYLRQHSGICMARRKEVHFFDNKLVQQFPSRFRLSYYHSFFHSCAEDKLWGEATPIYMWWPGCLERIKVYNPHVRLIFVLRDPVFRAYSHWNMERQRGFEKESFSVCIRRSQGWEKKSRVYSYVSRGFYSEQVKRIKGLFTDDQLLFIKHEELLKNPTITLKVITKFLNLSPLPQIDKQTIHARDYDSLISRDDEEFLRYVFFGDVEQVERELGWDLSDWKGID